MVMGFEETATQREVLRQPLCPRIRMQEQQLRQPGCSFLESRQVKWPKRQWPVSAGKQEHTIRLSEAEVRPSTVRRIATIEHNVMRGFEPVKPLGGLVRCGCIKDRRLRAHIDQRVRKAP